MKRNYIFVLFFFLIILFFSCNENDNKAATDIVNISGTAEDGINKKDLPVMKLEEEEFNFGTITQGEKVSHKFKFRNMGNSELIISDAASSCGCTVPEYPKLPINPGKSAEVNVEFDSNNKSGMVTKEIALITNCMPNRTVIRIKANIFVPVNNKTINP